MTCSLKQSLRCGLRVVWLTLLTGLVSPITAQSAEDPLRSPIHSLSDLDLENGQTQFRIHCARCHGILGEGGEGPNLKRANLRHAPDDQTLYDVINDGIVGTGMPGTFGPNDAELWQIAGYVRSLGRLPHEELPGDPVRGQKIYETRGACATCHISAGVGRGIGPELTDVGLRRNQIYLRRALTNPDADQPFLSSGMTGRVNAFLTVRAVSTDGEFEGLRINEDEFSIQIRDLDGNIRSFDKRQLLNLERAYGHSLMPGYDSVLNGTEVDDLVAYLMSLKGGA